MKTTKNNIVVFLIIVVTHLSSYAQYNGGDSSGSFSEELSITSCGIPAHFNAYFGGFNDGATNDELSNTACGFPPSFFAYLGGTDDGATVDELSATICGFPPSFYAYFGGIDDGAATDEIVIGICPFPPSFYAYFGGFDDGFVVDITVPICPTAPPVASFTASATEICVGQSVTFTDTSINIPSGWTWTFTGGTPSSSSVQNPVITYNTPGSYAVTLLVANFNGTDTQTISGYITVTASPTITATTPADRCDAGTVILGATASAGNLSWYANPTGGTAIGTGTSFTTPSISITTTYYVETVNATCSSARTAVIATVNSTPTVTAVVPASRCDAGSVNLSATISAGGNLATSYNWYNVPTGGAPIGNSNTFNTPIISVTTPYYIAAVNGTCISPRTEVVATVNTTPIITSTTPATRCDSGTLTLNAVANSGTLDWYANSTSGASLGVGTSFTTSSISITTTYYVAASTATCTSARIAVTATITSVSAPTGNANQTFCAGETVGLLVTTSGSSIVWYNSASAGAVVPNNTPLVSGAIYHASQNNGTCESTSRLAVTATLGNCLGIDEVTFSQIKVYPNPVTDMLTISNTEMMSDIMVADMLGRILSTRNVNDTETQIDMSNYPTGTYLVEVTVDGAVKTFKVIKR